MGDRMTPMPFPQLVEWVMKEHKEKGTVFVRLQTLPGEGGE